MDSGSHPLSGVWQEFVRWITEEWMVRLLLLTSMLLQLVLVLLGPRRYYTSSAIFRFVVWGAYISADAVAISALSTMMHKAHESALYGIWAPVLLLHLGGPDAITAYSMADNELWLRHGLNMVYQVSVAVYVIYSSAALEGQTLASGTLLLVAGVIKYGERIFSLWLSTYSRIVGSCLPISKYMNHENVEAPGGYVVMGEKQLQTMIEKEKGNTALNGREIATIRDVQSANIPGKDYNLCLSHALFKMYKRRFANLPFKEGDREQTKHFWVFKLGGVEAFRIVEMELKLMYDAIFSKCAAFSKWGIALRFLNSTLMGVAGFLILNKTDSREAQQTVTYVVISVALFVEVFQLCRIMISDWTRVSLICARVDNTKWRKICSVKVLEIAVLVLDKIQNVVGGDTYKSTGIHQHCLMETCLNSSPLVWRIAGFLPKDNFVINGYIKARHVHKVSVQDELKIFIFDILKTRRSHLASDTHTSLKVLIFKFLIFINELEDHSDNLEEMILILHLGTAICETKRVLRGEEESEYVRFSRILSRYCAYLLLSRPNLLPLHPDMARIAYLELLKRLLKIHKNTIGVFRMHSLPRSIEPVSEESKSVLGAATELARRLLERDEDQRWLSLAQSWGLLVIYVATYNKASFHAECLAGGGEFLSQLWVLLAHMGYGEQSDTAVKFSVDFPKSAFARDA